MIDITYFQSSHPKYGEVYDQKKKKEKVNYIVLIYNMHLTFVQKNHSINFIY